MKHYPLAVVELLGYIFTWIFAVAAIQNADYGFAAGIVAFAHVFDAMVTSMIARKGLHTRAKGVAR